MWISFGSFGFKFFLVFFSFFLGGVGLTSDSHYIY